MKSPPFQYTDDAARNMVEDFIAASVASKEARVREKDRE